jgi:hypothetical protein
VDEREPELEQPSVGDLLDEWREAERDAEAEVPESAGRKMARKRANHARDEFHEAEDDERERQGNPRPRKPGSESGAS